MHVQPSDALPKIMLARYYGANLGRFLSTDPGRYFVRSPQSWNRYAYSANNPINFFDPDGREVTYASKRLEKLFTQDLSRSPSVRATLARYTGKGKPDLHISRGDAGKDRDGSTALGKTTPRFTYALKADKSSLDPKNQPPQSGKNVTAAELQSATLVIDDSVKAGSGQERQVALHELGHVEKAAADPVGYLQDGSDDAETDAEGNPIPHDDRPLEQEADEYKKNANKEIRKAK